MISYSQGLAQKPAENSFQINGRGLNFSFHHQYNAIVGTTYFEIRKVRFEDFMLFLSQTRSRL